MVTTLNLMAKPNGAACNLACQYCYYLGKENLYPGGTFRMTDALLKSYTHQYIEAQHGPEVTFVWQGGEPTLIGLDFYRRALHYQKLFQKPGMQVRNALQTNATLLNDEWCRFLRQHEFLVGVSLDGLGALHDTFRMDKGGASTFARVIRGIRLLQRYGVAFNILTTVHSANAEHPLVVYRFLRDEIRARFIQFIPIVERNTESASGVTPQSVSAEQYGAFLIAVFDEWVRHDVGRVYVQLFDVALAAWAGYRPGLCVFEEICGTALVLEHNGDVYSCDHFVEPAAWLGNIAQIPLTEMVNSEAQRAFGLAKRDTLPQYCQNCAFLFVCHGGCPKNRFSTTPDKEAGLNYLCEGYRAFFAHIHSAMAYMAGELKERRPPANIMRVLANKEQAMQDVLAHAGRNDLCPCGSGLKVKKCHGSKRR